MKKYYCPKCGILLGEHIEKISKVYCPECRQFFAPKVEKVAPVRKSKGGK